jgi:hypothetical protein
VSIAGHEHTVEADDADDNRDYRRTEVGNHLMDGSFEMIVGRKSFNTTHW